MRQTIHPKKTHMKNSGFFFDSNFDHRNFDEEYSFFKFVSVRLYLFKKFEF